MRGDILILWMRRNIAIQTKGEIKGCFNLRVFLNDILMLRRVKNSIKPREVVEYLE